MLAFESALSLCWGVDPQAAEPAKQFVRSPWNPRRSRGDFTKSSARAQLVSSPLQDLRGAPYDKLSTQQLLCDCCAVHLVCASALRCERGRLGRRGEGWVSRRREVLATGIAWSMWG